MGIFILPPEDERQKYLKNAFPRWLHTSKSKFRLDIDHYIFTHLFRTYVRVAILVVVVIISILLFSDYFVPQENNNFENFIMLVDSVLPYSLVLMAYYFALYRKNVDFDKYSLFKNRETGKPICALVVVPLAALLMLPVIQNLLEPSNIYWIFESDEKFWGQYYDEVLFVIFAAFILVVSFALAAFVGFLLSMIIYQAIIKYLNRRRKQ